MHRMWCLLEQQMKEEEEYFGSSVCFNVGKGLPIVGCKEMKKC